MLALDGACWRGTADPMELTQLHVGQAGWTGPGGADPPASPRGGTQPGLGYLPYP